MSKTAKSYYELLELSANANQDTIERMFRYLATKFHPDSGGDKDKFSSLVKAFEVLRDPTSRAAYDAQLQQDKQDNKVLVEHAQQAGPDAEIRNQLLHLFYMRRRQANGSPGIGTVTVENEMDLSPEILNFHLWFFREKGWIKREEDGGLSITAEGVERAEASKYRASNNFVRIETQPQFVPTPSMHVGQANAAIAIHAV